MKESTSYEEAVKELRATRNALNPRYPCSVTSLTGQTPAVAELYFEVEISELRLRLIDLDYGSWAFSIIEPKPLRPLAYHSIWTGRRLGKDEKLPLCPGCGTYSEYECRHARDFKSFYVAPSQTSPQVRATLLRFLAQTRQSTA